MGTFSRSIQIPADKENDKPESELMINVYNPVAYPDRRVMKVKLLIDKEEILFLQFLI